MLLLLLLWAGFAAAQDAQYCQSSKWHSAFLANVTAGLPEVTHAEFCSDNGSRRFLAAPSDYGIAHYVLPGSLDIELLGKQNGTYKVLQVGQIAADDTVQTPVLLHLWLRALCIGSSTSIRGFGMLQPVHPLHQVHGQMELEMLLAPLSGASEQQHKLDVYWRAETERSRFNAPFSIETSFPHAQTALHYQLHIGGFIQHVIFSPKVLSCLPVTSRQMPVLITVLPHSHTDIEDSTRLELVTQMLIQHVHHHLKLGVAGTVHYDVEPFLSKLASNLHIQNLVKQGSLRLIPWDMEVQGFMPNGLVWHKNSAKALQYNHAVLAHWGLDVYVNPMDIDEFMATKRSASIAQLLKGNCIVAGGQTLLYRFDVRCGSCNQSEPRIWLSDDQNPLTWYNETDWKVRLRGKPIVYADTSYSMSIHEAGNWHGGLERWKPADCLFHIHLVNLFGHRRGVEDDAKFSSDTSWNWLIPPRLV